MDQCVSMLYRDTKHETTVFSFRSIVLDSLRNREIPATKTRGKKQKHRTISTRRRKTKLTAAMTRETKLINVT